MQEIHLSHLRDVAKRHDYELYLATRLAPHALQPHLWAVMALDYELSRIPSITQEEMIRMIRLTWWREAVEEIYAGKAARRHEVAEPLAEAIQTYQIAQSDLLALWEARQQWVLEQGDEESCDKALWKLLAHLLAIDPSAFAELGEVYAMQRKLRNGHSFSEEAHMFLQTRYDSLPAQPAHKAVRWLCYCFRDNQRRLQKMRGDGSLSLSHPSFYSYIRMALLKLQRGNEVAKPLTSPDVTALD